MGWRRTSVEEARSVLGDSTRVSFSWECRKEPATLYGLAARLDRSEGSLQSVARSLDDAGAIRAEQAPRSKGKIWRFNPDAEWNEALDIQERRMSTGLLRPRLRLVMVPATAGAEAWRMLATTQALQEVMWVAECHAAPFTLIIAVDERVEPQRAERVVMALQAQEVRAVSVRVDDLHDRDELGERAQRLLEPFAARDIPPASLPPAPRADE